MSRSTPPPDFDVIIVGAGPTGSALAGDLGRRGKQVLLLDQTDGVVPDARLHTVNTRTMELARAWGIEHDLRHCGWPLDHPQDVVWGTSLSDPEIARISWPAISEMVPPPFSPTFAQRCPQKWFNPILLAFAQRQESVTTLMQWQVDAVVQDDDQVQVHARSTISDEECPFTAHYLVACDGARSNIRRDLGITTVKSSVWGTSAEVIIESAEMKAIPLAQTLGRFTLVEATGMAISLLPFDGRDQYRITWMVGEGEITLDDMRDAARRIAGTDVEIEFKHDILPWSNRETTATSFRVGRVFLAGDAAHTMPTTGGLGMNTGIQDSFDLAWKLDAVLSGWGGEHLLDTYDPERRAAVTRSAGLASSIYQDWVETRRHHHEYWTRIAAGGVDAAQAKAELGEHLVTTFAREFNNMPAPLGYHYAESPICMSDGTPPPEGDLDEYVPTARPGHRAPHVWLTPETSTLDVFGPGFTLLTIDTAPAEGEAMVAAAEIRGMPLTLVAVTDAAVVDDMRTAYEARFVLVRPDGHVAWRGDQLPRDPGAILDVVRGSAVVGETPDTADDAASDDRVYSN